MSWYNPEDARRCWKEGEYDAVVEKAVEHVAKESGNSGRKLTLRIYSGDQSMVLSDYLMAGEKAAWKIKEFAKAIGHVELFDSGEFDPINFVGCSVRVLLKVEDNGDFGEQNKIGKYMAGVAPARPVAPKPAPRAAAPAPRPKAGMVNTGHAPMTEEDIPF
jgi:hypothetical protein